jgi:hypothetical protein
MIALSRAHALLQKAFESGNGQAISFQNDELRALLDDATISPTEGDLIQRRAGDIAYERDPEGRYDWSETEVSYGGGGFRIDRERLSKIIAYALAHPADYYPSHEALVDLVQLWAEHEALNGGGPGWRERFRAALVVADELTRREP